MKTGFMGLGNPGTAVQKIFSRPNNPCTYINVPLPESRIQSYFKTEITSRLLTNSPLLEKPSTIISKSPSTSDVKKSTVVL